MNLVDDELSPYKYWWNRLTPKMVGSASLSSCEYFLFAGGRVQDAKAIGLSEPSWSSLLVQ